MWVGGVVVQIVPMTAIVKTPMSLGEEVTHDAVLVDGVSVMKDVDWLGVYGVTVIVQTMSAQVQYEFVPTEKVDKLYVLIVLYIVYVLSAEELAVTVKY